MEIKELLKNFKVGCARVNTAEDVVTDLHWIDRGDFVEYEDQTLNKTIKAFGIVPKMSETPGEVGVEHLQLDRIIKRFLVNY